MSLFKSKTFLNILGFCAAAGIANASAAQESTNNVASNTDWYVFQEDAPAKQCWLVSKPKETLNTDSSGRPKEVRRGEILLFVTYMPSNKVSAQISFAGGYPFAPDSEVDLKIGAQNYSLFIEGETAWALTSEDDTKIVNAMKRGAEATLTGRSARGTVTKDTFSLLGFTASNEEAAKRCAG